MAGPAVRLPAPQALALGMVIHELAEEAANRGVLSSPEGRLALAWEVGHRRGHGDRLEIDWQESGAPPSRRPRRKSFGRELVEHEVAMALGGTVRITFESAGVRVRLSIPLDARDATDPGRAL
jgi:two-component sensor histidine kinase